MVHAKLYDLVCCWKQSKLPHDLHDAIIITSHKSKSERPDCCNDREITLLSISWRVPSSPAQ